MSYSTNKLLLETGSEFHGLLLTYPVELDLLDAGTSSEIVRVSLSLVISGVKYGSVDGKEFPVCFGINEHSIIYTKNCLLSENEPLTMLWEGELKKELGKVKFYNGIKGVKENFVKPTGNSYIEFTAQI
ncbi:hypothetical protein [Zooshikella sp. RANM57]|uniref:hypothetical protein n=1 Tax=Zooshikella sp. RANM57 TaxID=3425863 RepID=UPI003D70005A